jgi:hypothetical protein
MPLVRNDEAPSGAADPVRYVRARGRRRRRRLLATIFAPVFPAFFRTRAGALRADSKRPNPPARLCFASMKVFDSRNRPQLSRERRFLDRSGAIFALVPSSGHHHASDRSLPRPNAPGAFGRGFANPDGLAARGDTAEYTSYECVLVSSRVASTPARRRIGRDVLRSRRLVLVRAPRFETTIQTFRSVPTPRASHLGRSSRCTPPRVGRDSSFAWIERTNERTNEQTNERTNEPDPHAHARLLDPFASDDSQDSRRRMGISDASQRRRDGS